MQVTADFSDLDGHLQQKKII